MKPKEKLSKTSFSKVISREAVLKIIRKTIKLYMIRDKKDKINFDHLSEGDKHYLSGFLDGDGSIITQIVRNESFKYKYTIRVAIVFYQKSTRNWFLIQLQKMLSIGRIRTKKDGMSELVILGYDPIKRLLKTLLPYIRMKKHLAKLVLEILDKRQQVNSKACFIEVCHLVDKTAALTDSKNRKYTASIVENSI